MQFLVDECIGPLASAWLKAQGHDVYCIFDEQRGMDDDAVLHKAYDERRILITGDKDFGEKIFRLRYPHHGVVFLRLDDERSSNQIRVLSELLRNYSEQLFDKFVVVTEDRVRFAKS
jgi:predicted nuclease of predicted toxin-antitoxin system